MRFVLLANEPTSLYAMICAQRYTLVTLVSSSYNAFTVPENINDFSFFRKVVIEQTDGA